MINNAFVYGLLIEWPFLFPWPIVGLSSMNDLTYVVGRIIGRGSQYLKYMFSMPSYRKFRDRCPSM